MRINLVRDRDADMVEALPDDADAPKAIETVWGLFELLLKAPGRLDPFVRSPGLQGKLAFGFGVITFIGMGLYAGLLFAVLKFSPPEAMPSVVQPWDGGLGGAVGLLAAYPIAVLLATLIVLPSYWFLGVLVGVRMPMMEVLTHSLKGKAASTVLLLGIAPIYGVLLTCVILAGLPDVVATPLLWIGLILPYLTGLRGMVSVEAGFRKVAATTPALGSRRETIPSTLMLSWAFLFTLVLPVVMLRLYGMAAGLVG